MAEPFIDFHLLTLSNIGEGICDHHGVVLIDQVVQGISNGKYDVAVERDSRPEECRCENVFVVNYRGVDPKECCICNGLPFAVGPLVVDAIAGVNITTLEVACHFTFSLRILRRDELWWGGLWFLDLRWYGFPSLEVGGWHL